MSDTASPDIRAKRGGRPTRAAAAERDERLLEIATTMFMEQGFDATSMDGLAEAAAVGKATIYARWNDKTALFADVLRRRILQVYEPIEEEFRAAPRGDLEATLHRGAARLLEKGLAPEAVALGRILSAQGPRFPDLAALAVTEGFGRQQRLVANILAAHADDPAWLIAEPLVLAEQFLALVLSRAARFKIYGISTPPDELAVRTDAAVAFFLRGLRV